jgi:hypothetical protein
MKVFRCKWSEFFYNHNIEGWRKRWTFSELVQTLPSEASHSFEHLLLSKTSALANTVLQMLHMSMVEGEGYIPDLPLTSAESFGLLPPWTVVFSILNR